MTYEGTTKNWRVLNLLHGTMIKQQLSKRWGSRRVAKQSRQLMHALIKNTHTLVTIWEQIIETRWRSCEIRANIYVYIHPQHQNADTRQLSNYAVYKTLRINFQRRVFQLRFMGNCGVPLAFLCRLAVKSIAFWYKRYKPWKSYGLRVKNRYRTIATTDRV